MVNNISRQKGSMLLLTIFMLTLIMSTVAVGFKYSARQQEKMRLVNTAGKVRILIDGLDRYFWNTCTTNGGAAVVSPTISALIASNYVPNMSFQNALGLTSGNSSFSLTIDQSNPITVLKVTGVFNDASIAKQIAGYMGRYMSSSVNGTSVAFFRNTRKEGKDLYLQVENANFSTVVCK